MAETIDAFFSLSDVIKVLHDVTKVKLKIRFQPIRTKRWNIVHVR